MLRKGLWISFCMFLVLNFGIVFAEDLSDNNGNGVPDIYDTMLQEIAERAAQESTETSTQEVVAGTAGWVIPAQALRVNVMPKRQAWAGEPIVVWGNVSGGSGIYSYEWDVDGDGIADYIGSVTNPRYINVSHTYNNRLGETFSRYTAKLKVSDGSGASDSDEVIVDVIARGIDPTADTPEEILKLEVNMAIEDGLRCLYTRQESDGSWSPSYYPVGVTGEAVLAFENQGHLPTNDPDKDIYAEYVRKGLDYLVSSMSVFPVGSGEPDVNGNGARACFDYRPLYWYPGEMYTTGIAMTALVASGDKAFYQKYVEDAVDYCAWAQNDVGSWDPDARGGWRYWANYGQSDNSVSQWPALGLEAARMWGIPIPDFVKPELSIWIDYIQDDNTGGSGYEAPWNWVNPGKTGALLIEQYLCGDSAGTPRVQFALSYIDGAWGYDNLGNYYAMYAIMKGCRLLGIETLPSGRDWYAEYAEWLVDGNDGVGAQQPDGHWPSGPWADENLDTAWALLILSPTVIGPPVITVEIDIKPGSWPNAINPDDKGVIPVAILTTSMAAGESVDFDATTVDPLSVRFGPNGATECHGRGHIEDVDGDGDLDMLLHFKTQETGIKAGDTEACLIGKTVEGRDIKGCDAIVTVPKGKPAPAEALTLEALAAYPTPGNPEVWIPYKLAKDVEVNIFIQDASGRLIRTLKMGYQPAGSYASKDKAAHWDGRNEAGEPVASGVYFYTIQAGDFTATKKMVIQK